MKRHSAHRFLGSVVPFLAIVGISVAFVSCNMPLYPHQPGTSTVTEVSSTCIIAPSTTVTIAWNKPPGSVESYRIYVKQYDVAKADWKLLAEIPATGSPTYSISRTQVRSGRFIVGVSATYSDGKESPKVVSLDPTALHPAGWYLSWLG